MSGRSGGLRRGEARVGAGLLFVVFLVSCFSGFPDFWRFAADIPSPSLLDRKKLTGKEPTGWESPFDYTKDSTI
jgi:hypothetical protein